MVQFLLFRQGTPWFRALCKGSLQPVLRNSVDAAYVAPCLLITKSSPPRESLRRNFSTTRYYIPKPSASAQSRIQARTT